MKFMAVADTDIGARASNQDSLLIRHARTAEGEALLCLVCDGLGGLEKGELASATLVRLFSGWFDREVCAWRLLADPETVSGQWDSLLTQANLMIKKYGESRNIRLGSTFSGIFFAGERFHISHVGDSRICRVGDRVIRLTEDQTLAAREVRAGRLKEDQARTDGRRNVLTQCVGVFSSTEPQRIEGRTEPGVYLLCSDGFYHKPTEREIAAALRPEALVDRDAMRRGLRFLIDRAKAGGETDNISAIAVRVREEYPAACEGGRSDPNRPADRAAV